MKIGPYEIASDEQAKVLVVFSGGQDSTTCLLAALETRRGNNPIAVDGKNPKVFAIGFSYGQKHSIELAQAKMIAVQLGVDFKIIDLNFFGQLVSSALTQHDKDINVSHERLKDRPASFVPNRNALFLTLAHAYAQEIGASEVWTGVCETDYSGYPDCRQRFIDNLFMTLDMGAETDIDIVTPLMHMNKAQTFHLADLCGGLTTVLEYSHTCYNGDHSTPRVWGYGCGDCPACQLRANGWIKYIAELAEPAE